MIYDPTELVTQLLENAINVEQAMSVAQSSFRAGAAKLHELGLLDEGS
jgi:hypothetical protein